MSLLCRCLRALRVVSLFSFAWLSFYRCLAVAGFAFVVCGGFCALSGCFWRRFAFFNISVLIVAFCVVFRRLCVFFNVSFCRWFVFFCANFSSLLMSVFIFFSAVECCLLAICVFTFPHYKLGFPSAWRFVFSNISVLNRCFSYWLLSFACFFSTFFCALCAWFRWFPSFIYHFIVVWRLPALRLLCAAVSALCPVVFDGVLHFCVNRCFSCYFPTFLCFFCANFSSLLMSVFACFSVVECCFLAIFVFTFPHYKLDFLSAWRLVLR